MKIEGNTNGDLVQNRETLILKNKYIAPDKSDRRSCYPSNFDEEVKSLPI